MARECELEMTNEDIQMDWDDTLAAVDNETDFLEPVRLLTEP